MANKALHDIKICDNLIIWHFAPNYRFLRRQTPLESLINGIRGTIEIL